MTAKYLKKSQRTKSRDLNTHRVSNYRKKIKQTKSIDLTLTEAIKKFFPQPITPLTIFQKQSPSALKINQKLSLEIRNKINSCRIDKNKRRKNLSFSTGKDPESYFFKFGNKRTPSLKNNIVIQQNLVIEENRRATLSVGRKKQGRDVEIKRRNKGRVLFEEDEDVETSIPLKIQ